ncbi:hypothetical protein B296_00045301 [Ensete ventricosum]|uniref:Uncharacterized protein n=1 Tax=Ensete ventricosum TaxID=4639 RepID=A0A426XWC7_ENSVE|nr:hypothetical protein B296_00045301 [Ensete ventricosum]
MIGLQGTCNQLGCSAQHTKKKLLYGQLLLRGGTIVQELVEIHPHIGILRTFGEWVLLDLYLWMRPPQLFEHHPVPELKADLPQLLKARLESSRCLVGGNHLRPLGLQLGLKKCRRLDQR